MYPLLLRLYAEREFASELVQASDAAALYRPIGSSQRLTHSGILSREASSTASLILRLNRFGHACGSGVGGLPAPVQRARWR
jgi:hypothetical protein